MEAELQKNQKINDPRSQFSDPTSNVLMLVEAAVKRLDDLRIAEATRINEVMTLHQTYGEKLTQAEAKRIDAIRAVDVAAVATASERANQQATVLANQVTVSAETLRTLVATTADGVAKRIAALEQAQYENVGKGRVSDPIMETLLTEVKAMRGTSKAGISQVIGWIVALAAIIGLIIKMKP